VTFAAGQTQQTITVTVLADPHANKDLVFYLDLSDPFNAVLNGTGAGTGTILVG
jgi:hypothetical protein